MYDVSFIGLGKLGMTCAEAMADKGILVSGYDIVEKTSNKIKVETNIENVLKDKDFIFISVNTPHVEGYDGSTPVSHLETKDFDYTGVLNVLEKIKYVKNLNVVLISTVLPKTCRNKFKEIIDSSKCNFIYNPYLISIGTTAKDMLNPEMIILGNETGELTPVTQNLINLYKSILEKDNTRVELGTWEEAESIKMFYNVFISMKISFVNMIQDVAENCMYIDSDKVNNALINSTDRIISDAYMKPGMGDGGPCHPRDNIAIRHLSKSLSLNYDLFGSIVHSREEQAKQLAKILIKLSQDNMPIVILGKSFKHGTDITDGSYSLLIGYYIKELNSSIPLYYDKCNNNESCVYLLAHRGEHYNYPFYANSIVVDPWREFNPSINKKISIYYYGNSNIYELNKQQNKNSQLNILSR